MLPAFASGAYAETIRSEESEAISDEIRNSGEFYVATPNINMFEGSGERYAATIKRGGDDLEAASVRLTIIDITAQYGKDYTIEVPDKGFFEKDVENTYGASSIYSLAQENDGRLDEVNGLDDIAEMNKTDEEIREMYDEDIEALSEDLSAELQAYVEEKSEETGKSGEEIIQEANEKSGLSAAFEAATGLTDDSAPMDGGGENANGILNAYTDDKLTELAKALDSPYIVLDFDEGETEKVIEIVPKDNNDSEGNRMFLANLFPESDNAAISEIKGITAVIEDDEEWSAPTVEFAENVYYPENGFADITIKREGVLTDVAAVKLTTSDGTAMGGRDYSTVDTTVVFPFGISERTIKVPVSSEYIDTAADFNLTLSNAQNCTIGTNVTAVGIVEANSVSYKDAESGEAQLMADAGVEDVIVSDTEAIDHLSPYSTSAHDNGYTRADGDDYVIYASSSKRDKAWSNACWDTHDGYAHYDYDGYQIDWTKESGKPCYTDNEVSIYYDYGWHTVWNNTDERWDRKTTNIYPRQNKFDSIAIDISKKGAYLGKSPTLKIHSIKPILRPFEVSLKGADALKFRNENGDYVDSKNIAKLADATSAVLQGADKTGTGTAVKFSGEKITVTTTSKYAYISGLKIVHPSNGASKVIESGLPSGTTSVSINLTNDFIMANLDYINFVSNGGGSRIKGQFTVQPVFNYYDVTVSTHNNQRATITLDGYSKEPSKTITRMETYSTLYYPDTGKYLSAKNGIGKNVTMSDTFDDYCEWKMTPSGTRGYTFENPATGGLLTVPDTEYKIMKGNSLTLENKLGGSYRQFFDEYKMSNGNSVFVPYMFMRCGLRALSSGKVYCGLLGDSWSPSNADSANVWAQWQYKTDESRVVYIDNPADTDETFTLHRGDTVKFTQVVRDSSKTAYGSSRIRFIKRETSDSETIDDKSLYNAGADSYIMFLDYASVDAYVNLDKRDNKVVVRVAQSDVSKFDTSVGIFKNSYEQNGNYRNYTIVPSDKFSTNEYIEMTARTKDSGNIARWQAFADEKRYSQETFYFETKEENEDNVITLTCQKADSRKFSVTGTAHYSEVALAGQTEGTSWRPASGVYVNVGNDYYGLSDGDGNFATIPQNGVSGCYQIYKIDTGGTRYGTVKLSADREMKIDNGNGGTDTVNAASIGDIKVSVTRADVPHAAAFTAANANNVINGNIALISDDITYMTATIMNNGSAYTDSDGKERTEKVKKVEFVIYDPITNKERSVVTGDAKEIVNQNGMSVWQMGKAFKKEESHLYTSSDKIYVRVTTDRVKGNGKAYNEKGEIVKVDALNETTYPDVYTGYTLATTNTEKPVTHDIDIFSNNLDQFLTLPALGSMNATFLIKSVSLSIEELPEGGFRLCLGYAKGKESAPADDGGAEHQVPFTPERIGNEFNKVKSWGRTVGPRDVVGFANGGLYPIFGIYLDFGLKDVSHLDPEADNDTDLVFLGGGAMLGAIGEFRIVIYGAIGPVPVYFGIDGSLAAFVNIGIKVKNADTLGDGAIEYKNVTFREIKSGDKKIQDEVLFDFALEANGSMSIYAGAGIAGTFGVRGGAQIGANFIYYPTITKIYDINPVGLQITVGLRFWVDLVLLSVPSPQLELTNARYGYYKDLDRLKENNPSLFSLSSVEEPQTDGYGAVWRKSSGKEEKWLPNGETASLMSTFEMDKTTVLSEDGYEHASPQLMDLGGGRILLVYLASDLSKGDYDRTSIVYNIYDNGHWVNTAPVKIDPASTKGDFEPNLCDMGDKILISWTSRDNDNNTTDAKEYLKGLNVYTAVIDKETLEIGNIEQLTDDDYYNSHPVGLYDEQSGDYIVYYLKSEVTDIAAGSYEDSVKDSDGANLLTAASPTTNGAKLMYRLHNDAAGWVTEKLSDNESVMATGERFVVSQIEDIKDGINSDSPRIIDFDAISYDGRGVYSYTIDLDNNIDTMEDRELYVQIYDFAEHKTYKPVRITNNNLTDTTPQLVKNGENTYLFWRQDENTIRYINIANLVTNGMNADGTLKDQTAESSGTEPVYEMEQSVVFTAMDDINMQPSFSSFKVFVDKDDNMFIAWTQGESGEDGRMTEEVYASAYIRETETFDGAETQVDASWSEGMRLTKSGAFNDGIAVWTDANGNLITVNNQYDIDYDAPDGETVKNMKLISTEYKTVGSAEIKDVSYYDNTPLAGSTDTVTINVKNKGLKTMKGFTLKAYENRNGVVSDTPVFETTSEETVTPSSIAPVTFDWQMPDSFDGVNELSLHITVQETGYDKINEFDSDSIEFKPEYELNNVRTVQTMFGMFVIYYVKNTGNVDADGSGDRVVMEYVDVYDTGSEPIKFIDAPVPPVKAGEELPDFNRLEIPYENYFKYGRLNSTIEVWDKDDEILYQAPNVSMALEYPRDIELDDSIPFEITYESIYVPLKEGESCELNASYTDSDYFKNGTVEFVSSDPSVAAVIDGKLCAVGAGTATIKSSVNPYGGGFDFEVIVEGEDSTEPTPTPAPRRSSGGGGTPTNLGPVPTVSPTAEPTDEPTTEPEETSEPEATEAPDNGAEVKWFIDVPESSWYYEPIKEAFDNGRMSGMSEDYFEPETNITRGMFAYAVYRRENMPETDAVNAFEDVKAQSYYETAVAWAAENGIVKGYDDTHYGPDDTITREQMAAILWRYAQLKGHDVSVGEDTNILSYADAFDISEYAVPAIQWAVGDGVIAGFEDATLRPQENATRAQMAVILNKTAELF